MSHLVPYWNIIFFTDNPIKDEKENSKTNKKDGECNSVQQKPTRKKKNVSKIQNNSKSQ